MAKRNKGVEAEATTDAVTLVELWATPSAHYKVLAVRKVMKAAANNRTERHE
jgi:hypothetical protein